MLPFAPLAVIAFVFYNYFYEVKFTRPPNTYLRNMRLLQTIMQVTGDAFEVQYYLIEHFLYWKSKEKTLFTLNVCFIACLCMLPLIVIPLRYLIVAGMWGLTGLSSPFFMAVGKSLLQVGLEYGIVLERFAPAYIDGVLWKVEMVYIPRVQAVLRWVPYVCRYIPTAQQYSDSVDRRKGSQQPALGLDRGSWVIQSVSQNTSVDNAPNMFSGRKMNQDDANAVPSFASAPNLSDDEAEETNLDAEPDKDFEA